jgi:hypothetical protein
MEILSRTIRRHQLLVPVPATIVAFPGSASHQ